MEVCNLLKHIPQVAPFRFLDDILEIDSDHIVGKYTFKNDEYFYRGHFPGNPVTPGVILTETMAQTGIVALGLYLLAEEFGEEALAKRTTFFTDANVEYLKSVRPGETVIVRANKIFWRKGKLRCEAKLYLENGELVSSGIISGMGVLNGK